MSHSWFRNCISILKYPADLSTVKQIKFNREKCSNSLVLCVIMFYQCKNFIYNSFFFSRRKERLETRHKENITVKLYLNIESRAVAAVREEILSRQCDSSIVFLKDNRRGLEHAHHRDTVPLKG